MPPLKPDPLYRFTQTNYLVAAWLEPILSAAYGDVDGDGRPDVAVLVPKGKGSAVKIYLNQGGKFTPLPDAEIDLPELGPGWKLRMLHAAGSKTADFFVSSENQAVLLRSPQQGPLHYKAVPLAVIRGSQVATGDFRGRGQSGPRHRLALRRRLLRRLPARRRQLPGPPDEGPGRDVHGHRSWPTSNGDERDDLITSCGDIFLRQAERSLAETPSFHLTPPPGRAEGLDVPGRGRLRPRRLDRRRPAGQRQGRRHRLALPQHRRPAGAVPFAAQRQVRRARTQ